MDLSDDEVQALVGDAGLVMDPVSAQGIGNGFVQAEWLAAALTAGLGGTRPLAAPTTSGYVIEQSFRCTTSHPLGVSNRRPPDATSPRVTGGR
jgi:hypothetical protein